MKIDPDEIYDVKGAAKAVGKGERFIRSEVSEGRLVAAKLSARTTRIKGTDLQTWLDGFITKSENLDSLGPSANGRLLSDAVRAADAVSSARRAIR